MTGMGFGILAMLLTSPFAVADDARDCTSIAFQPELESEARKRIEAEDAARRAQGLPPEYHGASRTYREYQHMLDLLEAHEGDCDTTPLRKTWETELWHARDRHERVMLHVNAVNRESIEGAVTNLRRLRYNPACAHMRFTNPGAVSGTLFPPTEQTIEEMLEEPRIARLMEIAAHGGAEERASLLTALQADYAEHGLRALDHEGQAARHTIDQRPLAALPLLLAELDDDGGQLATLMDMTRESLRMNFGDEISFEGALLDNTYHLDPFSGLLAHSVEISLRNLSPGSMGVPHRTGYYATVERVLYERVMGQRQFVSRDIEPWEYYSRHRPMIDYNATGSIIPVLDSMSRADNGAWKSDRQYKTALTLARGADAVEAMRGTPPECPHE